jgi:hypothetical protein
MEVRGLTNSDVDVVGSVCCPVGRGLKGNMRWRTGGWNVETYGTSAYALGGCMNITIVLLIDPIRHLCL